MQNKHTILITVIIPSKQPAAISKLLKYGLYKMSYCQLRLSSIKEKQAINNI